jgi:serine/threonine protein kinase
MQAPAIASLDISAARPMAASVAIGGRLGPYEIVAPLGAGGMGEVYRARDTRLNRAVALKILPAEFALDRDRLTRFEREAQAVAALNHPHIVTIYSVDAMDDRRFFTMELVEGKTLADLIARHGLPLTQILNIAIPLADALSAAHQRGIVHRDLKPTNVMVTPEGRVKVLDFGIARLLEPEGAAGGSTTLSSRLTDEGRVVGTAAYMSPEQAEGKALDQRSDIFSLGIVLYELTTGRRPFAGDSSLSVLSSIVKDTPPSITELNRTLPAELARIVRHCLVKDPGRRYQTAADVRNELEELKQDLDAGKLPVPGAQAATRRTRWSRMAALAVTVTVLAAIGRYVVMAPRRTGNASASRTDVTFTKVTTQPGVEQFPSLSPDGKWIVYVKGEGPGSDIYLQSVSGQTPIANLTKDSPQADTQPAFSPDGESIAFRSQREGGGIFVMGRTGESVRRLTGEGFLPSWSPDGTEIVYSTFDVGDNPFETVGNGELWAVKTATGEKRHITPGNQPCWSPHGQRIAYWHVDGQKYDIFTTPAGGGEPAAVTDDPAVDWNPAWSADGRYLYFSSSRGGSFNLWRVLIDEQSGKTLGPLEQVTTPSPYVAHLSFSADGRHLAYASMAITENIHKAAFDPASGTVTGEPIAVTRGSKTWSLPDPSPVDDRLVFISTREHEDLFVSHSDGSGLIQLTNDAAHERFPRWSPDGRRIAYHSNRGGRNQIWVVNADGSGLQRITENSIGLSWPSWSPDGTQMAASSWRTNDRAVSIPRILIFDPNKPWNVQTPHEVPLPPGVRFVQTSWSPDGEWLAGFSPDPEHLAVAVYSLKSGTYQRLTEYGGGPIVWLNDSRRLLFGSKGNRHTVFDRETRQSHEVGESNWSYVSLSRDNRTIYFVRREAESDIWMATLK